MPTTVHVKLECRKSHEGSVQLLMGTDHGKRGVKLPPPQLFESIYNGVMKMQTKKKVKSILQKDSFYGQCILIIMLGETFRSLVKMGCFFPHLKNFKNQCFIADDSFHHFLIKTKQNKKDIKPEL